MPGIAELVERGADLTALRLLARTDRSALAAILKELGYSKMGHRMELEKALLLDPPAEATGKPPAQAPGKPPAEALGKATAALLDQLEAGRRVGKPRRGSTPVDKIASARFAGAHSPVDQTRQ